MPVAKEFIVLLEDRPSTLGKSCQALADRGVNILALHSFPIGGRIVTRFIVDPRVTQAPEFRPG
jgi:prephenate dehydratase